jgi:hypothetical protein
MNTIDTRPPMIDPHHWEMACYLVPELARAETAYIYGSSHRPTSATWCRFGQDASHIPADYRATGYYTHIVTAAPLTPDQVASFELTPVWPQ